MDFLAVNKLAHDDVGTCLQSFGFLLFFSPSDPLQKESCIIKKSCFEECYAVVSFSIYAF